MTTPRDVATEVWFQRAMQLYEALNALLTHIDAQQYPDCGHTVEEQCAVGIACRRLVAEALAAALTDGQRP